MGIVVQRDRNTMERTQQAEILHRTIPGRIQLLAVYWFACHIFCVHVIFRSPTHAGGLFAIDRSWFKELGYYDEGLQIWGRRTIRTFI